MPTETQQTRDRTPFGQRLFLARSHAGLKQDELAKRVGMTQGNISGLEKKGFGSEKTVELARACGVRSTWLATGEGPMLGPESDAEAARSIAAEAVPQYLAPTSSTDYRTIVHTLAASLEGRGLAISLKEFVQLADDLYRHFNKG